VISNGDTVADEPFDVRAFPLTSSSMETAVALAEAVLESIQEERLGRATLLSICLTEYLRHLGALRFGTAAGNA
jgi:hypothetical protein